MVGPMADDAQVLEYRGEELDPGRRRGRGVLVGFGILMICVGAAGGLGVLGAAGFAAVGVFGFGGPPEPAMVAVIGLVLVGYVAGGVAVAGAWLWAGIGAVRGKPWAGPMGAAAALATFTTAATLAVLAALSALHDWAAYGLSPFYDVEYLGVVGVSLLAGLGLPAATFWAMRRRATRELLEADGRAGYWRATPPPAGAVLLACAALALVVVPVLAAFAMMAVVSPPDAPPWDVVFGFVVVGAGAVAGAALTGLRWRAGPIVVAAVVLTLAALASAAQWRQEHYGSGIKLTLTPGGSGLWWVNFLFATLWAVPPLALCAAATWSLHARRHGGPDAPASR